MESPLNHLIVGCGYLGQALLKRYSDKTCWLINRGNKLNLSSNNHEQISLDINDSSDWEVFKSLEDTKDLIVYFMIPPSKIDAEKFPAFIEQLDRLNIKRRILVSSTVVYGRQERIVDADSEVDLDSERAKRQYHFEQDWLNNSKTSMVVRMAGIYGQNRIIGKQTIETGDNLTGNPDAWLNLIHVDDAAALLECLAHHDRLSKVELGSDGVPLSRKKYYSTVAELLNKNLPDFKEKTNDKGRCCNIKLTSERTGWLPTHTDIKVSLVELLKASANG